MNGSTEMRVETRVRLGAKQTAKGNIQLDLTCEAPTVDEAGRLMNEAITRLRNEVHDHGLELVSDTAQK